MLKIWMCLRRGSFTIFCGSARIVYICTLSLRVREPVYSVHGDELFWHPPLHVTHVNSYFGSPCGVSTFWGNGSRPLWSELSELWDSQSILLLPLSPCLPSVFLVAPSPSLHSDGGHACLRAENGQSGSSHVHYYHCSSSLTLTYRRAILPFSFCRYLSHLQCSVIQQYDYFNCKRKMEGITLETQQYRDSK